MSDAPQTHQRISHTSATDGGIALAGILNNVVINAGESNRPPKPCSTVPFRRDRDFVDRGELLSRIGERCTRAAGRAALVGLGGAGKSQLAIEYTYRIREQSPDTWVFWIHASNAARFEQGFRDIAESAKITGREDCKADVLRLVHDWLRESEEKWLMVLDNIDNADFLTHAQAVSPSQSRASDHQSPRPLRDYLPQSQNGAILVTTRSRKSALKVAEENEVILIDPMGASHAFELLDKKLGSIGEKNERDLKELAGTLEYMPLAIVQAASYILRFSPRYSVRRYIEDVQQSDRKKLSLLRHAGGELRRDSQAKNAIITTWQTSFEHIQETRQSAAELLSLMSFCDPQGIPEGLVRYRMEDADDEVDENGNGNRSQSDKESDPDLRDDEEFEIDVRTLRDFSFVSTTSNPSVFQMSRLVQLATRKWLHSNKQLEKWKRRYIKILYKALSDGNYGTWATCRAFLPDMKSVVTLRPMRDNLIKASAILPHDAAHFALFTGSIAEVVELSETAMKGTKRNYRLDPEATLKRLSLVGLACHASGPLDQAEKTQTQLAEMAKRLLGEEHPDTLTRTGHLAMIYSNEEQYEEGKHKLVQVLDLRKRVRSN